MVFVKEVVPVVVFEEVPWINVRVDVGSKAEVVFIELVILEIVEELVTTGVGLGLVSPDDT